VEGERVLLLEQEQNQKIQDSYDKKIYLIIIILLIASNIKGQLSTNYKIYIESETSKFASLDTANNLLILGIK
jgi:hypothetical protein